jgi:hypothetical protein
MTNVYNFPAAEVSPSDDDPVCVRHPLRRRQHPPLRHAPAQQGLHRERCPPLHPAQSSALCTGMK